MANLSIIKELMKDKSISVKDMSAHLNMTPQGFLKILRENSTKVDTLEAIAYKLKVSPSIFFGNKDEMQSGQGLPEGSNKKHYQIAEPAVHVVQEPAAIYERITPSIPLVELNATKGLGSDIFNVDMHHVKEVYSMPKLKHMNVDFMVEIYGPGMQPDYAPGDIVACSIIRNSKFIQWNKCHLITTTEQGVLIKRICQTDNDNYIFAASDNQCYPPFLIPKNEITGIALVVGIIRIE